MEHVYEAHGNAIALSDIKNIEEVSKVSLTPKFIVKFRSGGYVEIKCNSEDANSVRHNLVTAWNNYLNGTTNEPPITTFKHTITIEGTEIPFINIDYVTYSKNNRDTTADFDIYLKSGNKINIRCEKKENESERLRLIKELQHYLDKALK